MTRLWVCGLMLVAGVAGAQSYGARALDQMAGPYGRGALDRMAQPSHPAFERFEQPTRRLNPDGIGGFDGERRGSEPPVRCRRDLLGGMDCDGN